MWKNCKFLILNGFCLESGKRAEAALGSERVTAFVDFNLTTGRGMFSLEGLGGVMDMSTAKKVSIPKRISIKNVTVEKLIDYSESRFKKCNVKKGFGFFWDHYFIENEEYRHNGNLVARLYSHHGGNYSAEVLPPRSEFSNFKKISGKDKDEVRGRAEKLARSFGWSI